MSETEYEIIFGNPFDPTARHYRNPYMWEDESVSSTSSSSMMLADEEEEWEQWERGQALRERANRRRRRLRHYHSLTRKFKAERSEAAKELFDMIVKCEKLEKRLDGVVERFQALTYEKLNAERRAYNAQAELDELRGRIRNPPPKRRVLVSNRRLAALRAKKCAICLQGKRTIAFVPCGHVACCEPCAQALADAAAARDELFRCPICREHCDWAQRLFHP